MRTARFKSIYEPFDVEAGRAIPARAMVMNPKRTIEPPFMGDSNAKSSELLNPGTSPENQNGNSATQWPLMSTSGGFHVPALGIIKQQLSGKNLEVQHYEREEVQLEH